MRQIVFLAPQSWMRDGKKVYYHSIIKRPHDGVERQIEGVPWQLGHGQWVVKVTGISGGVALEALTPVD